MGTGTRIPSRRFGAQPDPGLDGILHFVRRARGLDVTSCCRSILSCRADDRMRGTPKTSKTPVLILTAKDLTRGEFGRLRASHVHQLIRKGDVDRVELISAAARLLGRKGPDRKAAPTHRHGCGDGTAARILAIEDNPDDMATLRAILKDRCVLLEAGSGEVGILAAGQVSR